MRAFHLRPLFYARDKRLNIFGIVPILFMALFTSEPDFIDVLRENFHENNRFVWEPLFFSSLFRNTRYFAVILFPLIKLTSLRISTVNRRLNPPASMPSEFHQERIERTCASFFPRREKGKEGRKTTLSDVVRERIRFAVVFTAGEVILFEKALAPLVEGARLPWIRVQPLNAIKRRNGMSRHPGQVH